jgi:putative nucleotidyltransferase with HDIG domain
MLKRISVKDLCTGMFLTEFCGAWTEHPFWRERFLVTSAKDISLILGSSIREVWIDTGKGKDVATEVIAHEQAQVQECAEVLLASIDACAEHTLKTARLGEELMDAERACARSKQAVIAMFEQARMGQAVDLGGAASLVDEITDSIKRHPHALISLARLKSIDDYTYMHSVAVCALMIGLARQLKLPDTLIQEAGLAGLLHDIGKMAIPSEILNKPGKLTDLEFDQVMRHPEQGHKILARCSQVSDAVADVCLSHHEKADGTGYPKGLMAQHISLLSRMAAVCDVYDAITSDRPYKKAWAPADAIRKMAEWEGHFDTEIFQTFVKFIGIYPIGSLVRLQSGRLAVVVEQAAGSLLKPNVKVFFSTLSNTHIQPALVCLSKYNCSDRIVNRESNEKWGFQHLESLWQL